MEKVLHMKPREEAVEKIKKQLHMLETVLTNKSAWHYGKVELRELMDFIYEGLPKNEREEI